MGHLIIGIAVLFVGTMFLFAGSHILWFGNRRGKQLVVSLVMLVIFAALFLVGNRLFFSGLAQINPG